MAELETLFAKLAELSEKERLDPTLVPAPYSLPNIANEPFQDWLARLTPHRREKAEVLLAIFQAFGAQEGEMWVHSEINENIPQLSRFLMLRSIWKDAHYWLEAGVLESELKNLDWADTFEPLVGIKQAAKQVMESGLSRDVLAKFACYIATITANNITFELDGYQHLPPNAPGFVIQERDGNGELTGYNVDGLHESFFDTDVARLPQPR
ncbi:MAG: hypothetical protein ABI690_22515 [Chloroflexota bacterium]